MLCYCFILEFCNLNTKLVIAGGNAGLAAAYSARKLHTPCTVIVPSSTPAFMVERLKEEGATVEIHGAVSPFYISSLNL